MMARVMCVVLVALIQSGCLNATTDDVTSLVEISSHDQVHVSSRAELTPGQPQPTDVTSSGVTLTWLAPPAQLLAEPAARFITGYQLKVKQHETDHTQLVSVNGSAATNALVSGLMPKTRYFTTVSTVTKDQQIIEGKEASFETRASVPARVDRPQTADVSHTSLVLRWKE